MRVYHTGARERCFVDLDESHISPVRAKVPPSLVLRSERTATGRLEAATRLRDAASDPGDTVEMSLGAFGVGIYTGRRRSMESLIVEGMCLAHIARLGRGYIQ